MDEKLLLRGFWISLYNYSVHNSAAYALFLQAVFSITNNHSKLSPTSPWRTAFTKLDSLDVHSFRALVKWVTKVVGIKEWERGKKLLGDPKDWGPYMWPFYHTLAELCEENVRLFLRFIRIVPTTLSCQVCRDGFADLLFKRYSKDEENAVEMDMDAPRLISDMHNDVNRKLNKRIVPFTGGGGTGRRKGGGGGGSGKKKEKKDGGGNKKKKSPKKGNNNNAHSTPPSTSPPPPPQNQKSRTPPPPPRITGKTKAVVEVVVPASEKDASSASAAAALRNNQTPPRPFIASPSRAPFAPPPPPSPPTTTTLPSSLERMNRKREMRKALQLQLLNHQQQQQQRKKKQHH